MVKNSDAALDRPYEIDVKVHRSSSTPLYEQIASAFMKLMETGDIEPGQLIEDEVSLAKRLEVSRPTARHALQDLARRGLLVRKRGAGTRVAPMQIQRQLTLTSLHADLEQSGRKTSTKVLSYEVFLADENYASRLQCEVGTELISVKRLRYMDDVPLAVLHNVIPADIAPSLTQLSSASLYDNLAAKNIVPQSAIQTIGARNATDIEAELLDLPQNAALVTMQRTAFDKNRRVMEYGDHVYDAQQYRLTIPLVA